MVIKIKPNQLDDLLWVYRTGADDFGELSTSPYCLAFAKALKNTINDKSIKLYGCSCSNDTSHYFIKWKDKYIDSLGPVSKNRIKKYCKRALCLNKPGMELKEIPWKEATWLKTKRAENYVEKFSKELDIALNLVRKGAYGREGNR